MHGLSKLTLVELRLFLREPMWVAVATLLPTALLAVFGSIPSLAAPSPEFGGRRFIDAWLPSLVVITLAVLALQAFPTYLATYREKGVLRRLSTTPVHPAKVLVAQLLTNLAFAVLSVLLVLVVGAVAFGTPLPEHPLGFLLSFVVGAAGLFTLGLLVAAVAPTGKSAGMVALPLFFPVMFFGGVYLPREVLPNFLARIGDYLPPATQALQDSWIGDGPHWAQLAVVAATAVAVGALASRLFRWE
jgi:ABC-2 type transport system permease protein